MNTSNLLVLIYLNFSFINDSHGSVVQYPDGIYLTLDCKYYKPMHVQLNRKKQVCIPDKPIVEINGVEGISDLHNVPGNYSVFQITLTDSAFLKLKTTASHMAVNTMAFVLKDKVIFVFDIDVRKFNNIIEVKGFYQSREMASFYDQLSNVLKTMH